MTIIISVQTSSSCKSCLIGFVIGLAIGITLLLGVYFGIPRYTSTNQDAQDLQPEESNQTNQNSWFGTFSEAAVASDAGPCSEIGARKMRLGGTAVDAAIATMLCIGLYNPQRYGNVYSSSSLLLIGARLGF